MATTKTLTPTNQAITIAAFTEKPDNRTNVTNDDKLADAVNALNSKFAKNTVTLTDVSVAQYAAVNINLTSPGTGFIPIGYSFNTIYSWHEAMLSVYVSTSGPKLRIMSLDSGTNLYSGVLEIYWVKF